MANCLITQVPGVSINPNLPSIDDEIIVQKWLSIFNKPASDAQVDALQSFVDSMKQTNLFNKLLYFSLPVLATDLSMAAYNLITDQNPTISSDAWSLSDGLINIYTGAINIGDTFTIAPSMSFGLAGSFINEESENTHQAILLEFIDETIGSKYGPVAWQKYNGEGIHYSNHQLCFNTPYINTYACSQQANCYITGTVSQADSRVFRQQESDFYDQQTSQPSTSTTDWTPSRCELGAIRSGGSGWNYADKFIHKVVAITSQLTNAELTEFNTIFASLESNFH